MGTVRDRHGSRGEGACVPGATRESGISRARRDAWELGLSGTKQATRHRRAERWLSTTRRAAGVLRPAPAASSHSDRWTHPVIVNVGEAGLGELIVQAVVPAAVAGHVDFQGVESVPVLPERSPQGRDRRLAKNFAMLTMAFPI